MTFGKPKNWLVVIEYDGVDHNLLPAKTFFCSTEREAVKVCKQESQRRSQHRCRIRIFKYAGSIRQMTIYDIDKSDAEHEELPF